MRLRIWDYLANVEEFNGVSISANLQCTCGATEFQFSHTGKQTKGILAPFIIRKKKQLVLKAVCSRCQNSIIVYDSTKDGEKVRTADSDYAFAPFSTKEISRPFPVVIKYNYWPEKMKTGEWYSNEFQNCFIYIADKNGKAEKALIEE